MFRAGPSPVKRTQGKSHQPGALIRTAAEVGIRVLTGHQRRRLAPDGCPSVLEDRQTLRISRGYTFAGARVGTVFRKFFSARNLSRRFFLRAQRLLQSQNFRTCANRKTHSGQRRARRRSNTSISVSRLSRMDHAPIRARFASAIAFLPSGLS